MQFRQTKLVRIGLKSDRQDSYSAVAIRLCSTGPLDPVGSVFGESKRKLRISVMVTAESGIVTAFVNSKGCAVLSID